MEDEEVLLQSFAAEVYLPVRRRGGEREGGKKRGSEERRKGRREENGKRKKVLELEIGTRGTCVHHL